MNINYEYLNMNINYEYLNMKINYEYLNMNINYEKQRGGTCRQLTEAEWSVKEKKQTKTNRDGHTLSTEN